MPSFVIQKHTRRKSAHFDLMLEHDKKLATWSLARMTGLPLIASRLPDHRRAYLTYEGKISRGRGSVRIWDRGEYQSEKWQSRLVIVRLKGKKVRGRFLFLSSAGLTPKWFILRGD